MADVREVEGTPADTWDDLSWSDLSRDEKDLWKVFGWNRASWEEEEDAPDADDKYWDDLTSEEQEAATELGYTQESWDEE